MCWFQSYLENRPQIVSADGYDSRTYIAESGVPQGTHLGPVLFSIFINDITTHLKHCNISIFADDLKIYRIVHSASDVSLIQNDLDSIKQWCDKNMMLLNARKCFHIKYTRKKRPVRSTYYLDGLNLQEVQEIRDLGVTIDNNLTFNSHVDKVVKKSAQMLGFIRRNSRAFRSVHTKILLYNVLVRSQLEYACSAWSPFYSVHSQRIESIQRSFTRSLAFTSPGISHRNSYESRLAFFKMSSLRNRRKVHDLMLLHKIINGKIDSPTILQGVMFNVPYQYPRQKMSKTFELPQLKTNIGLNSPIIRMCKTYNDINLEIDDLDIFYNSSFVFKNKILKYFLERISECPVIN